MTHNLKGKIAVEVDRSNRILTLDGDQSVTSLDVTHNKGLGDNARVLSAIVVLEWEDVVDFSVPTTMEDT